MSITFGAMQNHIFKYRIDSVGFSSIDDNLTISSSFDQSEINKEILLKLNAIGLTSDIQTFNYIIDAQQLFVEGVAYELPQAGKTDLIFSE